MLVLYPKLLNFVASDDTHIDHLLRDMFPLCWNESLQTFDLDRVVQALGVHWRVVEGMDTPAAIVVQDGRGGIEVDFIVRKTLKRPTGHETVLRAVMIASFLMHGYENISKSAWQPRGGIKFANDPVADFLFHQDRDLTPDERRTLTIAARMLVSVDQYSADAILQTGRRLQYAYDVIAACQSLLVHRNSVRSTMDSQSLVAAEVSSAIPRSVAASAYASTQQRTAKPASERKASGEDPKQQQMEKSLAKIRELARRLDKGVT